MNFSRNKKRGAYVWNGLIIGCVFCNRLDDNRGKLISSSLWFGVTSCSNIVIKNAEIKFKHRTTKINFKRTDGKLLLLEISISLKK